MNKFNMPVLIKDISEDEEGITIKGYASTVSKDRAGDVVVAEAWNKSGSLDNYKKNPIILAYHDHRRPVGKATVITPTEMGLEIEAYITSTDREVYNHVKDGVLSTFSIGFGINDASYRPEDDTFYIKDVELHEISVVSVPCNQDCTFSVSKSAENAAELDELKRKFTEKGNTQMDPELIKQMLADAAKAAADETAKSIAEASEAARAKEAAEAAEAKRIKAAAELAAKELVADIEAKAKETATSQADQIKTLLDTIKANEEKIQEYQDEVKSVIAAQTNRLPAQAPVASAVKSNEDLDNAVLLGIVLKKGMFDTKFGAKVKASALPAGVNTSGSAEVSSSAYEAQFRTNLERDIQDRLVFRSLFRSIPMTSANMVLPIAPNATKASWVGASTYGTAATSGSEVSQALTEINLRTYKLAGYSVLPDELEEDTIIPMLPLIRQYLVEAMAYSIDEAILLSDGTTGQFANTFKGLLTLASDAGVGKISTSTASSSVKVTAAMISAARRKLGKRGRNARDIVAVVSQDAYYDLIDDPEWHDANLVTPTNATKLTGEVGSVFGIRIVVADTFAAPGDSVAWGVLLDVTNFVVPEQRGLRVELERSAMRQAWDIVASQRLGFNPIIVGEGVVSITYAATY